MLINRLSVAGKIKLKFIFVYTYLLFRIGEINGLRLLLSIKDIYIQIVNVRHN